MMVQMVTQRIDIGYTIEWVWIQKKKLFFHISGYTWHIIGDGSITVELERNSAINNINILLWDGDSRSYSYYIETSVDQINWKRIVDHTNHDHCRSWQYLNFPSQVVRYIKLVGTYNTANTSFHAVALEAFYKSNVESK